MATILRSADATHGPHAMALNFDDLEVEAGQFVAEAKAKAEEIIAEAQEQADVIRQQAAEQGAQAAVHAVEQMVAQQLAPALEALQQAGNDVQRARQAWISHWESAAVHLASAIAERIIRGELRRQPEITLRLIREALELASGSSNVRLHLNPDDHTALGTQVRSLIDAMSGLGGVEITADATISQGGCRVETRFGTIDQQLESQLRRIEEELIG
jgi:flagellar assembly protein FliH